MKLPRRFLPGTLAGILLVCSLALTLLFVAVPSAGAAMLTTPTPTPTPTPFTGAGCKVTYKVDSQWPGSFIAEISITNTGINTVSGWNLQFTFPNGQQLQSVFNAGYTQVGANVTLTNRTWNAVINPGQTLTTNLGFVATWNNIANDSPASFTLNGLLCSKG